MSRLGPCIVLACIALLAFVAPASAGPPPAGLYECTISGTYFDNLKIKRDGKYERFGKTGKFTNPKARVLKFTTGPLKGFSGRWYVATSSSGKTPEIALRNPLDDFEDIYCGK